MKIGNPNPIADIILGIVFAFVGFKFIYNRTTIVDAFMASTKAFWETFGHIPNYERGRFISRIMIPFMGVAFLIGGIFSLYRFVAYFLR